MPLDELGRWLQARAERRPVATSIPTLDGYVPRSCRSGIDQPARLDLPAARIDADAFNHGGTPEFAAISAVVRRHNDISNTLSTAPHQFEPIHQRKPNASRCTSLCLGFHAAMQPRLSAWAPLLDTRNINHGLLRSILRHCVGRPRASADRIAKEGPQDRGISAARHTDIPAVVEPCPILDADPLRPRRLITACVEAHAGYEQTIGHSARQDCRMRKGKRVQRPELAPRLARRLEPVALSST